VSEVGVDPSETLGLAATTAFPEELISGRDSLEIELVGTGRTF